jgi:voltage-gated potassium channel
MPTEPSADGTKKPRGRRERWEDRTEWPLILASIAYLAAYSWLILEPDAPGALRATLVAVLTVVWAALILDIVVRIALTRRRSRWKFVRTHKVEVLSALIPVLRPFRLLRRLRKVPGFRGNSGDSFRSRLLAGAFLYAATFVYVIALSVLAVERGAPHATIVTFGDAVWWAIVTIATVGYGDFAPVTPLGRFLAILLMAGGVAIIGTASATIVSYLSEQVANAHRTAEERSADRALEAEDR